MSILQRTMSDASKLTSDIAENTCVVCFKNVEIFSIGECDHPVCYECSTRMRVLCQQNECPICRQGLSKVIFTKEKSCYRELEINNRSEYYSKKYKICFADLQIQKVFYELLEHPCPKCDRRSFQSFEALASHVRIDHELFYCDLCTENLKIFSFERKCYSRKELALHRRKGDPDNTSHRGHPNCMYCDVRYLDRDELFRHLRREHYYCHFCDADGGNSFYGDYDSLRDHFQKEHYLCEEGECAREEFTAVFRTEIDLKAHTANVHGKSLGKQLTKQARMLQVEITHGPRGRAGHQEQSRTYNNIQSATQAESELYRPVTINQSQPRMIDAQNEQEFPSLGGASSTATAVALIRPNMSMRSKISGPAGLARTKENFPALGGNGHSNSDNLSPNNLRQSQPPVSAVLKSKPNLNQMNSNSGNNMVIHASNKNSVKTSANNASMKKFSNKSDFPALPNSSKNNYRDDDYIPPTNNLNLSAVSAKHRILVDDYVPMSQQHSTSKINVIQKGSDKPNKKAVDQVVAVPKLTNSDFPALTTQSHLPEVSWVKATQRQQENENRKLKIAVAPILNISDNNWKKNMEKKDVQQLSKNLQRNSEAENFTHKSKKEKKLKNDEKASIDIKKQINNDSHKSNEGKQNKQKDKKPGNTENKNKQKGSKSKEKNSENILRNSYNNNNNNLIMDANKSSNSPNFEGSNPIEQDENTIVAPPPGFDLKPKMPKAPPGFKSVTLNSVAKPTNTLTFNTSSNENYSIIPSHQFLPPPDSNKRNQELVIHFKKALKHPEAVDEFCRISQKFQEGLYKAVAYYEHCQAALKEKFGEIFPELLVLLPDISKQQELFLVHSQYMEESSSKKNNYKPKSKLEQCSICKQVLLSVDIKAHMDVHDLENKFPLLIGTSKNISSDFKK